MLVKRVLSKSIFILYVIICFAHFNYSQPLNGSYTVGGTSPDFTTLQDAAHALFINGMSGPVNINIRPGTYIKEGSPGPVLLLDSAIVGLSETNRLTFQPDIAAGGNVDNVVLQVDCEINTGTTDREVVYIFRDYITLKNLTFIDADSADTPAEYLIRIGTGFNSGNSSIEDLVVDGCKLIGEHPYSINNQVLGTVNGIEGSSITTATITNNNLSNLRTGISLNFNSVTGDNVEIKNNHIKGISTSGVGIYAGFKHILLQKNNINVAYEGMQIASPQTGVIEANYISAADLGGDVLFVDGHNVTDSLIIKNNIIIRGDLGNPMQILTRNTRILHNTILNAGNNNNETIIMEGSQCVLLNNIILTSNGSTVLNVSGEAVDLFSNHNVFFKSGQTGFFAHIGSNFFLTFDSYSLGTGLDTNSAFKNVIIGFDSLGSHIDECQAQDAVLNGIHLPDVPVDFYGTIRDSVKPFVGAVEGVRLPFDMFGDPYRAGLEGFATSIAQGKFDNSSPPGIAVPDYDNNAVYLFHNNGASRTFTQYATLFPGFQPTDVYFYDLDDDGNLDLIIAGEEAKIEVRWGNGTGNFSTPTTLETLGRVRSIRSGHQNIDDLNTILLMEDNGFLPNSSFLGYLDNSNGRNLEHLIVQIPFTHDPDTIYAGVTDFVAGDLDGNGTDEVVAPGIFGSTNVQPEIVVLSDTSLGNYPWAHQDIYTGIPSANYTNSSIALGDFDGDGDNDFITNGWNDNYCVLVRNKGNLSFSIDTIPASASRGLAMLDYENDGDQDFVTINNTLDSVGITVFLNNGAGEFTEKKNCFLPFASGQPFGIVSADFDEDGMTDIAVVSTSFGGFDSLFVLYNLGGFNQTTGVKQNLTSNDIPQKFELSQNYPNPFNPSTKINFNLPTESNVKIFIYNILGQKVKELINEQVSAGNHTINFNANNLASGIYIYQIVADPLTGNTLFRTAKKMILLK
jgi:Secretion system C-terminal sorting domain/FG-GAP-like repeat